jgi:ubiquinone/menaquinone biosynthesis C-methylase UbiE
MPDVYATIRTAARETQELLAGILELRAADPQQRELLVAYTRGLGDLEDADLAEIGCGTGAVCRYLATLPGARSVLGVDPSPVFIERARELADDPRLAFEEGDARELGLEDGSLDVVVFHTALTHIPECERALAEAHRVLRPGGRLAVFDGDYVTTTVAAYANDPLQTCVAAAVDFLVHDPWLMRRLRPLLDEAGFSDVRIDGHAYTSNGSEYLVTLVERGADILAADGRLTADTAAALKAETAERVAAGTFFGHIAYVSAIGRRS